MIEAEAKEWGNSLGIIIPKSLVNKLKIKTGEKILIKIEKKENKKKNLSFFDCAGYIFARENNYKFVTGDKEFENLPNVEYIKS